MGNYKCINDLFPEVYEMKTWCMPLRCPRIWRLSLCSVNVAKSRRPRCFCTGLGTSLPGEGWSTPRKHQTELQALGDSCCPSPCCPATPGLSFGFVFLIARKRSVSGLSFSQILQTSKHRKCDGAGPQREKCLCSAWGTACWGLAGRETPKDSETCRDGKGLPACRSDFGLSVTGEGDGLLETKGGEVSDYPRRTRFNGRNMKPKNKVNKIWHSLLHGNFWIHLLKWVYKSLSQIP